MRMSEQADRDTLGYSVPAKLVRRLVQVCAPALRRLVERGKLPSPGLRARLWSNRELAKVSRLITGTVVNVSAWQDRDKAGRTYREYFDLAASYTVTNWTGSRGATGAEGEIFLDLTGDLPDHLAGAFDVVFNHTTLEHIYDVRLAFHNLCAMSCDLVILVVPFMQPTHADLPSWGDYWRLTPDVLNCWFGEEGLEIIYESATQDRAAWVYLFVIASRNPDRWKGDIRHRRLPERGVGEHILHIPRPARWGVLVDRILRL